MYQYNAADPAEAARQANFFDENHLNYLTSPDLVASPAQIRFMVHLQPDQVYYPCTERVYVDSISGSKSALLGEMYNYVWTKIFDLVEKKVEDPEKKAFLIELLNLKFLHETGNDNIIPSRLEKRLYKLFMVTTQIEDPMAAEKAALNKQAAEIYHSRGFTEAVNHLPGPLSAFDLGLDTLEATRRHLDATKLRRLLQAAVLAPSFETGPIPRTRQEWSDVFDQPISGDGWTQLEDFLLTPRKDLLGYWTPRRILYLADRAGEIVFDLAVAKFLIRLGHTVIMAVKSASCFDKVYVSDLASDPALKEFTESAELMTNPRLTKNQLAVHLRNGQPFKIITDGTMEESNWLRTSVSFARIFKEVEGVLSKGPGQRSCLFNTNFEFTQDIYSLVLGEDRRLNALFKPRCEKVMRFTTPELEDRAAEIIERMQQAKDQGRAVMFYSGIVGSIPGETDTAIQVMTAFVKDLGRQQAGTFIINPSSYFEKGMDADDLMYMWEIVQRSGLIDIWRFQTYQDIEKSFSLLGRKVPPHWVGKDSTYSTGCTKERAIAHEVQQINREMQIIGPEPEKFIRRSEYGIGLFHDTRLNDIYQV